MRHIAKKPVLGVSDQVRQKPRIYEPHSEKTGLRVSDHVRHKTACTTTEDGQRLEISDLGSRGIVFSM